MPLEIIDSASGIVQRFKRIGEVEHTLNDMLEVSKWTQQLAWTKYCKDDGDGLQAFVAKYHATSRYFTYVHCGRINNTCVHICIYRIGYTHDAISSNRIIAVPVASDVISASSPTLADDVPESVPTPAIPSSDGPAQTQAPATVTAPVVSKTTPASTSNDTSRERAFREASAGLISVVGKLSDIVTRLNAPSS